MIGSEDVLPVSSANPASSAPRGVAPRRTALPRPSHRTVAKLSLTAPALGLFTLFYVIPVGAAVVLSLYRWDGLSTPEWIGLENYRYLLFDDPVFWTNLRVSVVVVGLLLATVLPAALVLALCLSGQGRLMPLFRWLLFLPVVMPLAAIALLWAEIFNPAGGIANRLLDIVGLGPVGWLADEGSALWSIVIVAAWSSLGFHVVIQASALSAIPTELKEAARLETSSPWKVLRYVVLPLLRDAISVSAVLLVTGSFVFVTSIALIMTRGGPVHATEVLGLRAYLEGFQAIDFGKATAVTVISMLVTIAIVGVTLLVGSRGRVEY
jgi:ABC-type sugar transport system permease subunit